MFEPILSVCVKGCKKIYFTDITGIYDENENVTGWGNPNILPENVISAFIHIEDCCGEIVHTYDVTSQIPDPVEGEFEYAPLTISLPEGEYSIIYEINYNTIVGEETILNKATWCETYLNDCQFRCCIDKLIARIPEFICDKCDDNILKEVLFIEALYIGYLCASSCDKEEIRKEIEKRLKRFCDFKNCKC